MARTGKHVAFEPKILGFLCQWCGYAGADLAGVSRFKYPPNLRIVRVMCSGRVDLAFIVGAFAKGMDGVMVLGCHPGDCHYITGNYEAMNMAVATRLLLQYSGVNSRRFLLDWVSASEGMRFSKLVSEFTATVTKLGPLGSGEGESEGGLVDRLAAAQSVAQGEKLRYLIGRFTAFVKEGNKYGERFTEHEMERMLGGIILEQLLTARIMQALQGGPLSVKDMAIQLDQPPARALTALMALKRKGQVELSGIEGHTPRYGLKQPAGVNSVC